MAPILSARALANDVAQTAKDVLLENTKLVPITNNSTLGGSDGTGTTPAAIGKDSLYKYTKSNGSIFWLAWDEPGVNVVPGPIAGDVTARIYWTGEGTYPKMADQTLITSGSPGHKRLGIPAPTGVPLGTISESLAKGTAMSFNGVSGVDASTFEITLTTAQYDSLSAGEAIQYTTTGGNAIANLSNNSIYFVVKSTTPRIKLANTLALALATTPTVREIADGSDATSYAITPMGDGTQTEYSTAYVYTFVSAYGEEGPPSPVSGVLDKVDGQTVTLSGLSTAASGDGTSNTNLAARYIYRSNTGSNTTTFQFVKEISMSGATTTDSLDNAALGEVIPSTYWIGPPNEVTANYPDGPMKGLTAMPGGIMAGFTGKRLCFSEPYLPHAWPVSSRITLEEEIVAIGMAGNGLIVTTKGTPYLVSGSDPRSMQVVRIEAAQACLNKESLVDMGNMVLYAGADGLVAAAGTDVQVVTESILSPQQWRTDYYPTVLKGFRWEGKYVGLYTDTTPNPDVFGGFIFDPRGGKNTLSLLTQTSSTDANGGFTDPIDNELYLIISTDSSTHTIQKFQGGATNQTFTWKSKQFVTPKPTSMGFLKVDAEAWPVTVKVYGDGSGTPFYQAVIAEGDTSPPGLAYNVDPSIPNVDAVNIPEPIVRLPATVASTFEIQIESAKVVNEVCIAESIDELRGI